MHFDLKALKTRLKVLVNIKPQYFLGHPVEIDTSIILLFILIF